VADTNSVAAVLDAANAGTESRLRCDPRHAPTRLVVEVTEPGIMRERTTALKVLGALRRMGVRVPVDDFGTGYSSFAKFRDIPADELKIDRSFVTNLHSPVDEQRVRSIIELAHNLNLQVVAEGVESRRMADRLKAMGCDRLQGFLFGMPCLQTSAPVGISARGEIS
jgi:EAL domain-containing protein (putative c-di-GMP-specific phosphodiesterase class I)